MMFGKPQRESRVQQDKCKIRLKRTSDGGFSYESNGKCSKDEIKAFVESQRNSGSDFESEPETEF